MAFSRNTPGPVYRKNALFLTAKRKIFSVYTLPRRGSVKKGGREIFAKSEKKLLTGANIGAIMSPSAKPNGNR